MTCRFLSFSFSDILSPIVCGPVLYRPLSSIIPVENNRSALKAEYPRIFLGVFILIEAFALTRLLL